MAYIIKLTCAAPDRHPVKYDPRTSWYRHDSMYAQACQEDRIIDGTGTVRSRPGSPPKPT